MPLKFSVLSYANALPLVHFLGVGLPKADLLYSSPRHSIRRLLDGQVDAALVPVIDVFTNPDLLRVPGLGIAADGDVTSVLLRCHRPLRKVNTIELDPESKTSNVLVKVLAQEHFQLSGPVTYTRDSADADASVCIGDRALQAAPALEAYDLAGQWKQMTGLPFVFAVWVVHRSCPRVEEVTQVLRKARERGCRSRRRLARLCSLRLGLPDDRCYDYLARRLHYDVGPRELEGMNLFRELAAEFLVPAAGPEVRVVPGHAKGQVLPVLERS